MNKKIINKKKKLAQLRKKLKSIQNEMVKFSIEIVKDMEKEEHIALKKIKKLKGE